MSIWWSLHLRREAASVPLARRLLVGTMETAGVDPDISYDLSVALSEACANAVEHGGDSSTGYLVTAFIDGDTCRIEVTDSGPGFPEQPRRHDRRRPRPAHQAPQPAAPAHDEHGRGLFLIESLTDHVRVHNRPGRQGAVVSFDKILKWREDAALLRAS
ncbi:ATP-binding protein [Streptomyces olivoreticuli]|uniref:Histidine kinase/HSP90-like ATPase domain-containing protein n=1 Tax=Streptomyces blastmyceticus TaxID=68180 RepID=A0ABN0X0N9_9ACTN|nr:ATP-binding protein [Streptomyces olivoreticuli]WKK27190.1 ATP-binding protein [Streptomyces olivoreticuli]